MRHQAVQARNPHIIKPFYLVPQGLGRQGCLLGHWNIAGPSSGDHDRTDSVLFRKISAYADPGTVKIPEAGSILKLLFQEFFRMTGLFRVHPCDQDQFLAALFHRLHDPSDLLRSFSRSVNHLSDPLTQTPVGI